MQLEEELSVSYRVTERCNANSVCKARCFSVEEGPLLPDPSLVEVKTALSLLRETGLHAVNLMGGDPGLRKDLPEIVEFSHGLGFETILTTNTLFLTKKKLDAIAPFINWLSISMEAEDEKLNDYLRGRGQFNSSRQVVRWSTEEQYPYQLKVNTQIIRMNMDHIDTIPDSFLGRVAVWKLLQFTGRGNAQYVMDAYAVTPKQYWEVVHHQRELHPSLYVVDREYPEKDPDTIILRPDGSIEINATDHTYEQVGNIYNEGAKPVLARAMVIYERLASSVKEDHEEAYPRRTL